MVVFLCHIQVHRAKGIYTQRACVARKLKAKLKKKNEMVRLKEELAASRALVAEYMAADPVVTAVAGYKAEIQRLRRRVSIQPLINNNCLDVHAQC